MLSLARCGLLACVLLILPASQIPVGQEALAAAKNGEVYTLSFSEQGELLADIVILFQKLLSVPVDYLPEEVSSVRVHVEGPQIIATDRVRDVFDQLLDRHGFWSWDDESGGRPQIVVRKKSLRGQATSPPAARLITLEELEAGPSPRLPLYTMVFPLEHLTARDQMATFMSTLDVATESLRAFENNALMVKATREHLLVVRDILAAADVPSRGAPAPDRLAALEQRLTAIEARLTALESPPGR